MGTASLRYLIHFLFDIWVGKFPNFETTGMPDGGQQLYVSSSRGNRREDMYSILNLIQEHPILSRVFDSMWHYTNQDAIVLRFLMLYSRYCPRVSRIHHFNPDYPTP